MAEYQRGNIYQAVPASQAESEYKQQEAQYFATFADQFQKYANKFSTEAGLEHGAEAEHTRTIEVEENGQWIKKEVPEYSPHPLAGFTAYGNAYNEAAQASYLTRIDTDFIESSNRIMMEAGSDVQAFDQFSEAFEEGYFDGMSGKMRAQARQHWTEYKVKARNKVMVRAQEVALASNLADLQNSAEVYETISLRAARGMDVDEASDYRLRYFSTLDQQVRLGGMDADDAAERKRKFDKVQEEQFHLGLVDHEISKGNGLQYISNLKPADKYIVMDPYEAQGMIDKAWSLLAEHEKGIEKAEEKDKELITLEQDRLYLEMRSRALRGQAPRDEHLVNLVSAKRLRDGQAKELQDLRFAQDTEGVDNPNVVRELEDRLYSRTDVPTISEVLSHRAEGRLSNSTAVAVINKIDAEQRNPGLVNSDEYRLYVDELEAAFGIVKQQGAFAAFSTNEDEVKKAKRLAAAKRELYDRVTAGENIEEAFRITLQRWHPETATPAQPMPNIARPRQREAMRVLRELGIPVDEQTFNAVQGAQ